MEGEHDGAGLQWPEAGDSDGAMERHSAALHENIKLNNARHQNEKRALERNNTKLLVRIEELEREREDLKRRLEAAIEASTAAASRIEPASTANTKAPPRSSATASTQEATVPFFEHKELERMYNAVLRDNDGLRLNSEKLAKQHDLMKARVKEWSIWASKERAKRGKGSGERGKSKSTQNPSVDMDRPPTPMRIASPSSKAQSIPEPGLITGNMRQTIVEQALQFLGHHGGPLKATSAAAGFPEFVASVGDENQEELPQTPRIPSGGGALEQYEQHPKVANEQQFQPNHPKQGQALSRSHDDSLRLSSSQTTQDVDDGHENIQNTEGHAGQNPSSDDEPTVVSERSLKRKHQSNVQVYQDAPGQRSGSSSHVKTEPRDTESTVSTVPALLNRTSTLDLDITGIGIQTPRKRRRMQDAMRNSQFQVETWAKSRPPLLRQRSSSLPLNPPQRADSAEDEGSKVHDENIVFEVHDSDPSPMAEEQDESMELTKAVLTRSPENPRKASVLRSRDVNIQPQLQLEALPPLRPRRLGDAGRGAKAVHVLPEDGEDAEIRELSPLKMQESRRRLAELYNNPPPKRKALKSPRTPAPIRDVRASPRSAVAKNRDTVTPKSRKAAGTGSSKKSSAAQLPTPQTGVRTPNSTRSLRTRQNQKPASAPLRTKMLSDLNLSDFKINADANAGLEFAFTEVVRGSESRRCLPGCTKPECCGRELRAMVEAGLNPPVPQSFWEGSQSQNERRFASEEEEGDHRYLRWFLGNGYSRDRVDAMPNVQRDDLVVQAKVKLLANQAGRHRNAHQRPRTPPGFWRADFPGTQEMEKDREEARKREKEVIEERWREAMTEGGRWKFADE